MALPTWGQIFTVSELLQFAFGKRLTEHTSFQMDNLEFSPEIVPLLAIVSPILIPLLMTMVVALADAIAYYLKTHEAWFNSLPSTPLMVASYFGNNIIADKIVIMLLEYGADANARTDFDDTSLHFAACNDNPKIVEILLQYGADINARNRAKNTPLHIAAGKENPRNDFNDNLLNFATCDYNPKIVEILLQYGGYINARNNDKYTPLHIAVEKENLNLVGGLLRNGARTELKNIDRDTALHIAARKGNIKVLELLLKSGANPNLKNLQGETPLHIAVNQGNSELVELLLKAGLDPNLTNHQEESPLCVAVKQGNAKNVQMLLQHGADVNEAIHLGPIRGYNKCGNPYTSGGNLLHVAAYNGNSEIAEILLKNGARTDLKTLHGKSALDLALEHEHGQFYEVVDLLKNLPK